MVQFLVILTGVMLYELLHTFNLLVGWATAADQCDVNKLQVLAVNSPAKVGGSFPAAAVIVQVSSPVLCIFQKHFDHNTYFLWCCNVCVGNDASGTCLFMNGLYFHYVDSCRISLSINFVVIISGIYTFA